MSPILIILLILLLCSGGYGWYGGQLGSPYGYGPIGLILFIILVLAVLGRL
jgi:hypothetical protein